MNVKNFPERKRQRQLGAMARLNQRLWFGSSDDMHRVAAEIETLEARTAHDGRSVRTKKSRAHRAKVGA